MKIIKETILPCVYETLETTAISFHPCKLLITITEAYNTVKQV